MQRTQDGPSFAKAVQPDSISLTTVQRWIDSLLQEFRDAVDDGISKVSARLLAPRSICPAAQNGQRRQYEARVDATLSLRQTSSRRCSAIVHLRQQRRVSASGALCPTDRRAGHGVWRARISRDFISRAGASDPTRKILARDGIRGRLCDGAPLNRTARFKSDVSHVGYDRQISSEHCGVDRVRVLHQFHALPR